jgi:hypothetical protein
MIYMWFTGINNKNWPLRKIVTLFVRPLRLETIKAWFPYGRKRSTNSSALHSGGKQKMYSACARSFIRFVDLRQRKSLARSK